ncbi:MAG: hypothetical protein KatS3mg110_0349 [Pirellulaceae bacterium]|nr:MAG: hypothetical protein KatS3mg110_0349 [Pirellulaceae bacterium]
MAKLLALEWDSAEIRGIVGRSRGRDELVVEQAFAVPLAREGQGSDEVEIGPQLAAALRLVGVGRSDVLLGVGRANIEMRQLQLPAAPPEELPDMVRFQAMRQFTTIGEEWPLDFVVLNQTDTSVEVLAAAISPELVRHMTEACQAAHLTPKRLVLRPFAAASLLERARLSTQASVRLVVDVLPVDADLFVVCDGKVAFVRTVRLPHGETAATGRASALVGEIRRTVAAAQSQMGGRRIESVVVFGDREQHDELGGLVERQLNLPVECVDPFSIVGVSPSDLGIPAGASGRFAPLLGMLVDELRQLPPAIDFLHPKKRPQPRSRRERLLLYATAVIALFCVAALTIKLQWNAQDRQIAQLRSELKNVEDRLKEVRKRAEELKMVEAYAESAPPWLDELRRLSLKLPPAKDAIVRKLSGTTDSSGTARIAFEAWVSDPKHIEQAEEALRDDAHQVFGGGTTVRADSGDSLRWSYKASILMDPRKVRAERRQAPADSPPSESRPAPAQPAPGEAFTSSDTPREEAKR